MSDSRYPTYLDTDSILPRVDDNISEIGGEAINALRSAVFAIEDTLGVNPQGTASDVVTRLNRALNSDGTIKASALAAIALVTLPIVNSMVDTNAGIEELKLDLDYGTSWLKAQHDSNYVLIISIMDQLTIDIGHLISHVAHPSTYGRHYTSDIDGYAGVSYDGYNLQGIVSDLNNRIINHLVNPTAAHAASAIFFNNTGLPIVGDNVQTALGETALLIEGATIKHQDVQHSNGVLKSQDVFYNNTNHSYVLVPNSSIYNLGVGSTYVRFTSLPTNFSKITRGDRVDVTSNGTIYTRYVDSTNSTVFTVTFLTPLPISGAATAAVYKKSEEFTAPSCLNVAIRKTNIGSTGGSIIQLIHPNSPFVLSQKCEPRKITASVKNIKITWATGSTPDIDVYSLLSFFNAFSSTWTVENLSMTLNKEFADKYYPLISFAYKGELGIAFDEPDGYVVVSAPFSNSAWTVLGFSTGDVGYSLEHKFYIDGYEFTGIRKIVDALGDVDAGSTKTIQNINSNIITSGLQAPGILRIKGTSGEDGTYVFDQINNSTSLNIEEDLTAIIGVELIGYADTFSITTLSNRTLYDLYIDGYDHLVGIFKGTKRVEYYKEPTTSPQDMTQFFDVVDVSRNFPTSVDRRLTYTISGSTYQVQLGTRGSGVTIGSGGEIVVLPAPSATVPGYRFKAYDASRTEYIEFEVSQNYTALSTGNALNIDTYERPSEERYLQVGKVLHNKTCFKYLEDRRLFGTVGRYDVRDDFTRDYVTYPNSVLHSCGVIRDCSLLYSLYGTTATLNGGEVFVNGNVYDVSFTAFTIPNDGATTYNLYIGDDGVSYLQKNDQFVSDTISTPSTQEIIESVDKLILYVIATNASNQITSVQDFRKFTNNVDGKIELTVEEINEGETLYYGAFPTLQAAVNHINTVSSTSPISQTIRIRGEITLATSVTLPSGTTLIGDSSYNGSKITVTSGSASIICSSGCIIKNISFYATIPVVFVTFGNVNNIIIENCIFANSTYNSNNYGIVCTGSSSDVYISNCMFNDLETAILGDIVQNIYIEKNIFTDIRTNVFCVTGGGYNVYFAENVITAAYVTATANFIYILFALNVNIFNNIMVCNATSSAIGNMINISDISTENIIISQNMLFNTNVANQGLLKGILIADCSVVIMNNIIEGFKGNSGNSGIEISGSQNCLISGNSIDTRRPLLTDITNSIISNNYFLGEDNAVTVSLTWTSVSASKGNIFSGNYIANLTATTEHLAQITGTEHRLVTMTNNYFYFSNNSSRSLLVIDGYDHIVSNNIFNGLYFTEIGYSPLLIHANASLVTHNLFKCVSITDTSGAIKNSGPGTIDFMNKGAKYVVSLPINHAVIDAEWTWGTYEGGAVINTVSASAARANFHFSNECIPDGAQLYSLDVGYSFTGSAVFSMRWNTTANLNRTSHSHISNSESPGTGVAVVQALDPTSLPSYMGGGVTHFVDILGEAGTKDITIYGVEVTYYL